MMMFLVDVARSQHQELPISGRWVTGPRFNTLDLSGDAVTPATLSIGNVIKPALIFVGCRNLSPGGPTLELRASMQSFVRTLAIPQKANVTVGADTRIRPLESLFAPGDRTIFVVTLDSSERSALLSRGDESFGGISIAFHSGPDTGLVSAPMPQANKALSDVFDSCGGAMGTVSGPATPKVSSPYSGPVMGGAAESPVSDSVVGSKTSRVHFELEGIRLGMTLKEAVALGSRFGAPPVTRANNESILTFQTRDLNFGALSFNSGGLLYRMDIYTPSGGPATRDALLKLATAAFGKADNIKAGEAQWSNADGSFATYDASSDTLSVSVRDPTKLTRSSASAVGSGVAAGKPDANTLDFVWNAASALVSSLPNFLCDETIHSEQVGFRRGPVHKITNLTGNFRVGRDTPTEPLKEYRQFLTQDGSPVVPVNKSIELPYKLHGAYGPALQFYLAPDNRKCLDYKFSRGRIDFEASALANSGRCPDVPPHLQGNIEFNQSTGDVTHLERIVPSDVAIRLGFAAFASIDYKLFELKNSENVNLPRRIIAKKEVSGINQLFDGSYSGCRNFGAVSAICFQDNCPVR